MHIVKKSKLLQFFLYKLNKILLMYGVLLSLKKKSSREEPVIPHRFALEKKFLGLNAQDVRSDRTTAPPLFFSYFMFILNKKVPFFLLKKVHSVFFLGGKFIW